MTDSSLVSLLEEAFPCRNFQTICRDRMRWVPESGYVPSGFGSANGPLDKVQLIIITAEPSDPLPGETYFGSPNEMIAKELCLFEDYMRFQVTDKKSRYFLNLRVILDLFWPNRSRDEQLKFTWFTTSVKCAAERSGGPIKKEIEIACASLYLERELSLLSNAFVLALGGKARDRLKRTKIRVNACAQHPSARPPTKPRDSWEKAAKRFGAWVRERGTRAWQIP
ncbi:MAG: hypothetical protein ACREE3_08195 [Stellaceae bacterium]